MSETNERMFPVDRHWLLNQRIKEHYPGHPLCPAAIPWAVIAPHAAQVLANHHRTLESQAKYGGGLSPLEIRCAIKGIKVPRCGQSTDQDYLDAVVFLNSLVAAGVEEEQ